MTSVCKSSLVLRSRRGATTPNDEIALRAHLEGCPMCSDLALVLSDFDRADEARSEDGQVVARLAAAAGRAVQGRAGAPPWKSRWSRTAWARSAWLPVAAALLCMGVAAFAAQGVRSGAPRPRPAQGLAWAPLLVAPSARQAAALSALPCGLCARAPDAEQATARPVGPLASVGAPPPARALNRGGSVSGPATSTAAVVYQRANDARRAGDVGRAIELYRELQRSFPRTREAHLSCVSLGGLLLEGGSAQEALEQFDRYLAAPGAKGLGSEALYGRGRALTRLRRPSEEAVTWRRLLAEFPDSPYANSARRRLAELP